MHKGAQVARELRYLHNTIIVFHVSGGNVDDPYSTIL
jgi:hypothetical protein